MRRVVIVAFDGAQSLDITGPAEAFSIATRFFGGALRDRARHAGRRAGALYERAEPERRPLDLRGPRRRSTRSSSPAARARAAAARDERVLALGPARGRTRSRRVASVCTGAFLLAEAGLLDGRRATTHWADAPSSPSAIPQIAVEPDPIFVRDGNVYTSAGVTAGMDLALALVEEDLGADVALETARQLVLFLRRPGGQSQFSAQLAAQAARARAAARGAGAHRRAPRGRPVGARARRARLHEPAQLRARLQGGDRHDARRLRRGRPRRARAPASSRRPTLPVEAVAAPAAASAPSRPCAAPSGRRLGVNPAAYRERFAA